MKRETLYSKNEADFLSERENELSYDKEKMDVILDNIGEIESFLEIGCGSGQIIKEVVKKVPYVVGVDESPDRIKIAKTNCKEAEFLVAKSDELDYIEVFDVVLTKGFLVHIPRDRLNSVYDILYRSCGRFIVLCEYYNPCFVSVDYRGFDDLLFKNDYAGDMLDRFKDLKLHGYGFVYHRDNVFPQDDVSWFILEKI